MKITKGKWEAIQDVAGNWFINVRVNTAFYYIAHIANMRASEANARLIATAPALLEAC